MKRRPIFIIIIAAILILSFLDKLTTLLVFVKHHNLGTALEMNPLIRFFPNVWLFLAFTYIITILLSFMFYRYYYRTPPILCYTYVFCLVILIFSLLFVTITNYDLYQADYGTLTPILAEQRTQEFVSDATELSTVTSVTTEKMKIPAYVQLFIFNHIVFILWYDLEKGRQQ